MFQASDTARVGPAWWITTLHDIQRGISWPPRRVVAEYEDMVFFPISEEYIDCKTIKEMIQLRTKTKFQFAKKQQPLTTDTLCLIHV